MPDAAHVRTAEAYFRYAPDTEKTELARNILLKAKQFDVTVNSPIILEWAKNKSFVKEKPNDLSNKIFRELSLVFRTYTFFYNFLFSYSFNYQIEGLINLSKNQSSDTSYFQNQLPTILYMPKTVVSYIVYFLLYVYSQNVFSHLFTFTNININYQKKHKLL